MLSISYSSTRWNSDAPPSLRSIVCDLYLFDRFEFTSIPMIDFVMPGLKSSTELIIMPKSDFSPMEWSDNFTLKKHNDIINVSLRGGHVGIITLEAFIEEINLSAKDLFRWHERLHSIKNYNLQFTETLCLHFIRTLMNGAS